MDAISEQAKFLHRHGIDTEEELNSFREDVKQQIAALSGERKTLSNEMRQTSITEEHRVVIGKQINGFSI